MISVNIETLNSGENLQLQILFIKFDVTVATFKNLLNVEVLEECLNGADVEGVG